MHGRWAVLNKIPILILIHFLKRSQFIHLFTYAIRRNFLEEMKGKEF